MVTGIGTAGLMAKGLARSPKEFVGMEGVVVFVILLLGGIVTTALTRQPAWFVAGALIGFYLLFSIKVANQWEKAAVLRLGRYKGLRGPGLFFVIPMVETVSRFVDQRIRVTDVAAESALTRDTVPVNVDVIVFWVVWDAEKCILEVEDFSHAVQMSAQTALLESIGRHQLAQMITEREVVGKELQRILDEKTNPWGITVQSVDVEAGAGGAGAAGAHCAGDGGDGDFGEVRGGIAGLSE